MWILIFPVFLKNTRNNLFVSSQLYRFHSNDFIFNVVDNGITLRRRVDLAMSGMRVLSSKYDELGITAVIVKFTTIGSEII